MYNLNNFDFFDDQNLELAASISAREVGAALVGQGWKSDESRDDVTIYRRAKEEDAKYEIDLPKVRDERYAPRILDAALMASLYEKRAIDEVLAQWSRPRYDVAKFRLISDKVKNGTAPIDYVQSLLLGALSTLRIAIKDVESPCRYHTRVNSSSTKELMKRAELGQTEKGSYVINVLAPCGTQNEESSLDGTQENIYRRGVEHLLKTLDSAVRFASSDSPNDFLSSQENEGVSSNLLESILKMRREENSELEISVDWSPLLPPSPGTPSRVYVAKEHARIMSKWAQTRRPKEMEETRRFVGKVEELRGRDRDVKYRPCGTVVFSIFDEEENYEAEATLDADLFQVAYDAYYKYAPLAFEGRVVKRNGKAALRDVKNLRLV